MEFWVEKQGCLPHTNSTFAQFCTLLKFSTRIHMFEKQGCLPPILTSPNFAPHSVKLTPTHICTFIGLAKQKRALGQQQEEAFGIKRELEDVSSLHILV